MSITKFLHLCLEYSRALSSSPSLLIRGLFQKSFEAFILNNTTLQSRDHISGRNVFQKVTRPFLRLEEILEDHVPILRQASNGM